MDTKTLLNKQANRKNLWDQQMSKSRTGKQRTAQTKQNDPLRQTLTQLNTSPAKKVAGTGDEMRKSAIRLYQNDMDHRLAMPKRSVNRFAGMSEPSEAYQGD